MTAAVVLAVLLGAVAGAGVLGTVVYLVLHELLCGCGDPGAGVWRRRVR